MYKDTDRQTPLFGVEASLGTSGRRRLEATWAHEFARDVYPLLLEIESEFADLYGDTGRPNWSVARMLGVCILQEMQDLSDQKAVDALCFDNRWRYALGFEGSEDSYLSRQGLVEFRSRIARQDPEMELLTRVFDALADKAVGALGLSTEKQRIDSTLIESNIRSRARLDLLVTTLCHALKTIEQLDEEAMGRLSSELMTWYRTKDEGRGWFGDVGERTSLEQVGEWLVEIEQVFADETPYQDLEAVQLAQRVLHEHFEVNAPEPDPGGGQKVELEPRKHAEKVDHATTLQSPFDPDAGKGHKGQGYMLHIAETCGNTVPDEEEENPPEIITTFKLNPANQSDQNQAKELCDRLPAARTPEVLFADGGYINATSLAEADAVDIRLHGPVNRHGHTGADLTRLDFDYDPEGKVSACPEGHAPVDHRERLYGSDPDRVLHAFFDPDICDACENYDDCPVRIKNNYALLALVGRLKLRDLRYLEQDNLEWWIEYAIRSGIEATFSELKRGHGCRKLRVRGRARVKSAIIFKLMGCNVKRWTGHVSRQRTKMAA